METTRTIVARVVVALTMLIGGGTLMLFGVFLFRGPFGVDLGLAARTTLVLDASLCLVFCIQHSVMVRQSVRRRLSRLIPPHYYGALYTVASAVPLLVLMGLWQESEGVLVRLAEPGRWFVRALFLAALPGLLWSERSIPRFDPFGVRPILDRVRGRDDVQAPFTVRGPYRWVRHPQYFFTLVMFWAYPDLTVDRLVLNGIVSVWIVLGTILEERDLVSHFGEDYVKYRRRVPMLIPWRGPLRS